MLTYHQDAFQLIDKAITINLSKEEELKKIESSYSIELPKAFKELYSIKNFENILKYYSNDDQILTLSEIFPDRLEDNLIVFIVENQGVCKWCISINGKEDPPVLVKGVQENARWLLSSTRLSDFVYVWIWDHQPFREEWYYLSRLYKNDTVINFTKKNYDELISNLFAPDMLTYRFETFNRQSRIRIVNREDKLFTCFYGAEAKADMVKLLEEFEAIYDEQHTMTYNKKTQDLLEEIYK